MRRAARRPGGPTGRRRGRARHPTPNPRPAAGRDEYASKCVLDVAPHKPCPARVPDFGRRDRNKQDLEILGSYCISLHGVVPAIRPRVIIPTYSSFVMVRPFPFNTFFRESARFKPRPRKRRTHSGNPPVHCLIQIFELITCCRDFSWQICQFCNNGTLQVLST